MHPREISVNDFTYDLPDDRIAIEPPAERDASRMLIYQEGIIVDSHFVKLPELLKPSSLLVFNDSRVVHARIPLILETGHAIELFCLEPNLPSEPSQSFSQTESCRWLAFIGNNRKWKSGTHTLTFIRDGISVVLTIKRIEAKEDAFIIDFHWSGGLLFSELLDALGKIPLPPYIKREVSENDLERYQTVYSNEKGSVAAPTAGLHFSQGILNELDKRHIKRQAITLHVGAGTFKPVKSETLSGHIMHEERVCIQKQVIEQLFEQIESNQPIVAVGTTSLRSLESIFQFGRILQSNPTIRTFQLNQWDAYECKSNKDPKRALEAVLRFMKNQSLEQINGKTALLITPGYTFGLVQQLITNFHQPQSTLLLLVAAFIGEDWKKIYTHALAHDYRFLSYGDSSLLTRNY